MPEDEMEMPVYVCHKEICALKIAKVIQLERSGNHFLVPEDLRCGPIEVSEEYMTKHKPYAGGYYVVYKDGYKSFSPAAAFEEGYTPKE